MAQPLELLGLAGVDGDAGVSVGSGYEFLAEAPYTFAMCAVRDGGADCWGSDTDGMISGMPLYEPAAAVQVLGVGYGLIAQSTLWAGGTPSGGEVEALSAYASTVDVVDSILVESAGHTGVLASSQSTISLINSDLWSSGAAAPLLYLDDGGTTVTDIATANACGWTGCGSAVGNISADPLLVDPAAGDFHIQAGSQCIDAGVDPSTWISAQDATTDFEGDPRPSGSGWDIGADEL